MQNGIMGGADGPTAMFLAVSFREGDFPWLAFFGLVTVFLLFIPNMIAGLRRKETNLCENRLMNSAEKLGLLFFLLIILCGLVYGGWGFHSVQAFLCCVFGNILLVLLNWVLWIIYYFMGRPQVRAGIDDPTAVFLAGKGQVHSIKALKIAMAAVPAALFLLDGIALRHWLMAGIAVIYGMGHIYVARENINMRIGKNVQN